MPPGFVRKELKKEMEPTTNNRLLYMRRAEEWEELSSVYNVVFAGVEPKAANGGTGTPDLDCVKIALFGLLRSGA